MATLSTHVLDIVRGRPAADVTVELHQCSGHERCHITTQVTDADGRVGMQRLGEGGFPAGVYELTFHAGAYFRSLGIELPDQPFLDEVVIRFGIGEDGGHCHVPLLLSLYGYSTYRGS